MSGFTRVLGSKYVAPVIVFLVSAGLFLTGSLRFVDDKFLDARFRLFERPATSDLVIVSIDPESLRELGSWPWPRTYHAEVLRALLEAGANRVVLDIDFSSPSDPESDAHFTNVLQLAGRRAILPVFKQLHHGADGETSVVFTEPLPAFRDRAALASVSLRPDADGVIRRMPLEEPWVGGPVPFLAAELAGMERSEGDTFHLDFGIVPDTIPEISYANVLARRFDPHQIAGKNVIVAATALELSDYFTVPRWGVLSGAHVLALGYESLVQGRALHRLNPLFVLGLTFLVAVAFGSKCAGWNSRSNLSFLVATWAAVGAASMTAHYKGLSLDTSVVLLAAALCFVYGIISRSSWQARRLLGQHLEIRYKDTLMNGVVQNSFDAILILDDRGRIGEVNPAARQMFGDDGSGLVGCPIGDFIPRAADLAPHATVSTAPTPGTTCREMVALRVDHSRFPVEIAVREMSTEDRRWRIVFVRDITERKAQQDALEHQALHDALTGLPNRALLQKRLNETIGQASRTGDKFALLLLDLNRFKEINDTLGHHIGDVLLQQLARRLKTPLRETDMIARLGGDEFAVVFSPVVDLASVTTIANRLHQALEEPLRCKGMALGVGASIGVALFPDDGKDATELIQRADVAMYLAKNAGVPTTYYDRDRDHNSVRHLTLTGELKRAVEGEELKLYYQPKISVATGKVTGVEALARWTHPEHGPVPPDQFIALAEQTGLIKNLTVWALRTAIEQSARWRSAGLHLDVAVNLSPKILHDQDLAPLIAELLAEYDLEPERLILEITESAIMADPDRAKAIMESLTQKGVRVSIDDFGTGYSSLGYLKKLPVHELKIDRSFVTDMMDSESDSVIVKSIVELAHNLGLKVVAEGIERSETLTGLAQMGADTAQGFFIGLPTPASHFEDWLRMRQDVDSRPRLVAIAGGAH